MTKDQIDLLKTTICKGATDDQLKLFIEICKRTQLDPFSKQIYGIPTGGRLQIQVSIDGLRLIAERSGKYRGQVGPYFCGVDGEWKEMWLDDSPPVACKVGVIHRDFEQPLYAVCKFSGYVQNTPIWKKMPDVMIAKVAESLALRKAFPQDLAGIYSNEEMGTVLPAPVSIPRITISQSLPAAQATYTGTTHLATTKHDDLPLLEKEPQFELDVGQTQNEVLSPSDELEQYVIPFGKDSGKSIMEVGVAACIERVKWFESRGDGKPLSAQVQKFKEMVNLAVQQGLS